MDGRKGTGYAVVEFVAIAWQPPANGLTLSLFFVCCCFCRRPAVRGQWQEIMDDFIVNDWIHDDCQCHKNNVDERMLLIITIMTLQSMYDSHVIVERWVFIGFL